ncbi:MAG: carbohydrate-binding domain-containing protein [Erysipelotrichaceae bacterium]|nr:carbohydrate-binding domain-containing protein [Erysipelotrichaceae bacterium]MDD3809003.1 carbohydrate-binding domain-containing protein [Erysipelotrichaceae bacterium]
MKKIIAVFTAFIIAGCTSSTQSEEQTTTDSNAEASADTVSYEFTDSDLDYSYDNASATSIKLSDGATVIEGDGASLDGDVVTISSEGVYVISGTLSNGQIVIESDDQSKIQIVLSNVEITSSDSAPIYVKQADKVFVTVEGTNNLATSGDYENDGDTNVDGVIFSKDDLTINGDGEMSIHGPANGIVSKDDLCLVGLTLDIDVGNHGLEANDIIKIHSGQYNISSDDDCLNSSNEEDASLGNVYILNGDFDLSSGDDGIHATGSITIDGGEFSIDTSDDGVHSDVSLTVNGGTITVIDSYEGLESGDIIINDGVVNVTSSDDGVNVSGGNDSSGFGGGQDQFAVADGNLTINGGTVTVNASGDGLDSNGSLIINGGQIYVSGPTNSGNGALDYNSEGAISGGSIIAIGASGMDQTLSSSTQGVIYYQFASSYQTGSLVEIYDSENNLLDSYTAQSAFNMVVVSNENLKEGNTYTIKIDGDDYTIELDSLAYGSPNSQGGQRSMEPNSRRAI